MNSFLLLFVICIIILLPLLFFVNRGKPEREEGFLDEEGDHSYYDRHLIEKKEFKRRNPDVKDVRSLKRLFRGERKE